MYTNGEGVVQDYAEAAKWYRKAAEQGYARAQSALGFMYNTGYTPGEARTDPLRAEYRTIRDSLQQSPHRNQQLIALQWRSRAATVHFPHFRRSREVESGSV